MKKKFHIEKDIILPQKQKIISKNSDNILEIKYKQYLVTSKCFNNMKFLNNGTVIEIKYF